MLHPVTLLQELFRPEDMLVGFHAADKWEAIDRLMEHLVASGRVPEDVSKPIHEAVLARERSMSTGMERGIAIPHAAVEGLPDVAACVGIVGDGEEGLNFESIDHGSTHFVVLLLIPREKKLLHIRTLADVARTLGKDAVRTELLQATDTRQAWEIFCGQA